MHLPDQTEILAGGHFFGITNRTLVYSQQNYFCIRILFRVMLIQWQWRRLRRASYFSLSFAFHFSSPPADPSGFPSYFLFSLFLFFSDFIFSHSHFSSPPMDPSGFSFSHFTFISLFLLSFLLCSFPSTDPSGFSLSLSFSLLFPHLYFLLLSHFLTISPFSFSPYSFPALILPCNKLKPKPQYFQKFRKCHCCPQQNSQNER